MDQIISTAKDKLLHAWLLFVLLAFVITVAASTLLEMPFKLYAIWLGAISVIALYFGRKVMFSVTPMRLFWVSQAIAMASFVLPTIYIPMTLRGKVDTQWWALGILVCLPVGWLIFMLFCCLRYHKRAFWLLSGAPIALLWPVVNWPIYYLWFMGPHPRF